MKLIVGLGNPSKKYKFTRHNVGFMLVDALADKLSLNFKHNKKIQAKVAKSDDWILVKPQAYMNLSGLPVRAVIDYYHFGTELIKENFFLVHDDLDLKLGELKLSYAKGPKEHNGVISVEEHLKTDQFFRLRMGIDNRPLGFKQGGAEYVLSRFSEKEKEAVDQMLIKGVKLLTNH